MTRRVRVFVLALGLAGVAHFVAAPPARAEDVVAYQAEGGAPAGATDARVMALDDAFARAVASALADLVASDVRTARKGDLDKEVIGRARLWVTKFTVTKDETVDDRRELTVSVRIDRDKLRARLGELSVAIKEATPAPSADPAVRTATILMRIATPAGVRAGYGPGADKDLPGLAALTQFLRGNGFAVRRAPASGAAARADGELPLSDDEADALAAEAKADVMTVAGVSVGASVPVRGLATSAALVTAHVRMVERKDRRAIGQGSAMAAARGDDLAYAVDRAVLAAMADVMPPAPAKLAQAGAFAGDDTPLAEAGVVLVRLPAKTPYALVLAEQKYLAGAKGVRAASLRRLSPGGWVIGVSTAESIEQIARIVKKAPSPDSQAAVKIVGAIVEVALSGAP